MDTDPYLLNDPSSLNFCDTNVLFKTNSEEDCGRAPIEKLYAGSLLPGSTPDGFSSQVTIVLVGIQTECLNRFNFIIILKNVCSLKGDKMKRIEIRQKQ